MDTWCGVQCIAISSLTQRFQRRENAWWVAENVSTSAVPVFFEEKLMSEETKWSDNTWCFPYKLQNE